MNVKMSCFSSLPQSSGFCNVTVKLDQVCTTWCWLPRKGIITITIIHGLLLSRALPFSGLYHSSLAWVRLHAGCSSKFRGRKIRLQLSDPCVPWSSQTSLPSPRGDRISWLRGYERCRAFRTKYSNIRSLSRAPEETLWASRTQPSKGSI